MHHQTAGMISSRQEGVTFQKKNWKNETTISGLEIFRVTTSARKVVESLKVSNHLQFSMLVWFLAKCARSATMQANMH